MPGTGKRYRAVLPLKKKDAEQAAYDLIHKATRESLGLGAEGADAPLLELHAQYIEWMRDNRRPRTVEQAEKEIPRILAALGMQTPRDVTLQRVDGFRRARARQTSNRTGNLEAGLLRAFLNWCVRFGLLGLNPIRDIGSLPQGEEHRKRRARALSDEECAALVAAAQSLDEVAWLSLFGILETGLRYSELRQLKWPACRFAEKTIRVDAATAKRGRERVLPMSPALERAIWCVPVGDAWPFRPEEGGHWKDRSGRLLRFLDRALAEAGIPKVDSRGLVVHLHALRHTANRRWADAEVPLDTRQYWMGHSTPYLTATTYGHHDTPEIREQSMRIEPLRVRTTGRILEGFKP